VRVPQPPHLVREHPTAVQQHQPEVGVSGQYTGADQPLDGHRRLEQIANYVLQIP
jgi:hypothetical protein